MRMRDRIKGAPSTFESRPLLLEMADKMDAFLYFSRQENGEWLVQVDKEGKPVGHVFVDSLNWKDIGPVVNYLAGVRDALAFIEGENDAHS